VEVALGRDNEKANQYREWAKRLRSIELDVRSVADRKTLRAIAKDFEQMAGDVDHKHASRAKS